MNLRALLRNWLVVSSVCMRKFVVEALICPEKSVSLASGTSYLKLVFS